MPPSIDRPLVSVKILVGGSPIKDDISVMEVKVSQELNRIGNAYLKLIDGSAAKEDFAVSDSDVFVPGKELEVQAGFGLTTNSIFKGIIISQSIQASAEGGSYLVVECKSKAVKMTVGPKNGAFLNCTDSSVISKLISGNGLSADVSATKDTYPQIVQYYATDWDFMLSRAEANGLVVLVDGDKVTVAEPKTSDAGISFTFGDDIFAMDLKLDARDQLAEVKAQSWDLKSQAIIESSASDPSLPQQGDISGSVLAKVSSPSNFQLQTTAPLESSALKTWANAALLKSRLSKIRGEVKVLGNAALGANQVITLGGVGERFNGKAYVSRVKHVIENGNWWSIISIGLDSHWFAETTDLTARPASALLPGIRGLQNATVKQIYKDPAGETNVQVFVPMFKSESSDGLVWARWTQPYATQNAGQFFMPEVGDEVVLGFLNEDPRFPVILGSMYSSQHSPAYQPAEENPIKAIVTKNQLVIEFDDKNKVMTIKTPAGNQIQLTDKDKAIQVVDQHGNKIVLNSGGISLTSPSDIKINADGKVSISGTGGVTISSSAQIEISAQASLKASGLDVNISAETNLSAAGQAETSISSSGMLSVKGAMVMIN